MTGVAYTGGLASINSIFFFPLSSISGKEDSEAPGFLGRLRLFVLRERLGLDIHHKLPSFFLYRIDDAAAIERAMSKECDEGTEMVLLKESEVAVDNRRHAE